MSVLRSSPVQLVHLDLAHSEAEVGPSANPVLITFWWHDLPLGIRTFASEELPLSRASLLHLRATLCAEQLAARDPEIAAAPRATHDGHRLQTLSVEKAAAVTNARERLDRISAPALEEAGVLSVVVCTLDRLSELARCLDALHNQKAPPGEILVVDNSANRSAETLCSKAGVRFVHEPRLGLSAARNAGVRAAGGELIAFTDDDVEPHPNWSAEIVAAFDNDEVAATTGLVLPANLETKAQRAFQFTMGGFGSEVVPLMFGPSFFEETLSHGPQVWRIGAGANMAFRRSALAKAGPFDERLGAGASGCSEDSEMWYRLLAAGQTCLYEPRAVVFHHHRSSWSGLRSQMRAYMRGHVAALFIQHRRHGHRGNLRRVFWEVPAYLTGMAFWALSNGDKDRLELLWNETTGWASGLRYAWPSSPGEDP